MSPRRPHYLFHPMFWQADACYLQDLFADEVARFTGFIRYDYPLV